MSRSGKRKRSGQDAVFRGLPDWARHGNQFCRLGSDGYGIPYPQTEQQVDTPQNLYDKPANKFVAGFIGSPQMNFIDAKCTIQGDKATLTFGDYSVVLPDYKAKKLEEGGYNGKTVVLGIRPEDISDDPEMIQKNGDCVIESDVTGYELLGAEVLLYYSVAGANMTARVDSDTPARYGDHIKLAFDPHKIHVFDKETELTITN